MSDITAPSLDLSYRTLPAALTEAAAQVVRGVQHSLVVLHNSRQGVGAGVIWGRGAGTGAYILTNYHVVAHGRQLRAALEEGASLQSSEYPARLVATDEEIDLALLYIEAKDPAPAVIADSRRLRVGQLVLAVGHPWGQRGAVTAGLISGLSKAQTHGRRGEIDIIRSDARLAPGNSGGPLVDASGAVVGINTMIVGGDQGIAIPIHVASAFVEQAIKEPHANWGDRA
jgi:serine protease Do